MVIKKHQRENKASLVVQSCHMAINDKTIPNCSLSSLASHFTRQLNTLANLDSHAGIILPVDTVIFLYMAAKKWNYEMNTRNLDC